MHPLYTFPVVEDITPTFLPEILPCPFCGGKAALHHRIIPGMGYREAGIVRCNTCLATTQSDSTDSPAQRAIFKWNTRGGAPAQPIASNKELLDKEYFKEALEKLEECLGLLHNLIKNKKDDK